MEDVKEFLTDIVQEKGISSLIFEYISFPCVHCGNLMDDKNAVFWFGNNYKCYHSSCVFKTFKTRADKCKAIQLAISNDKK